MELHGQTALVTGGTDGIGAQLIRQLRAKGVTVITQGRNAERSAATRAGGPVYCATKAALRSYSQALRAQLEGITVHVLEALPPVVETKLTAGRGNNKMAPEECARQIVVAMEASAEEVNVGMVKLLQVVNSISPALARRIMIKF
ncbi:MAG: SDR family NAD(P)-dependent oxidoreductase [Sphingopyxis sp.]